MTYSHENFKELSDDDMDFIVTSLNQMYHHAHTQLERRDLGDLERGFLEQTKEKAKELMSNLGV